MKNDQIASPIAQMTSDEKQDREVFDLILSGHPTPQILEYVSAKGYGEPGAVAVRAVTRFTSQADEIPTTTQCGFLLDSYRELARKCSEIGDFQGARACLKDYMTVVQFLHREGLSRQPETTEDE